MLNNLQLLRAFAVLLVVYHHIPQAPFLMVPDPTQVGHWGVDIFFVISGFVMNHSTAGKAVSPGAFWISRLVRVVPLYWLITCAVFVIAIARPGWITAVPTDAAALVKSLLFIPFPRSNGFVQPVISVGWTLNYEMYFYALFGLALAFRAGWARLAAVSLPISALVVLGFLLPWSNTAWKFYSDPVVLEFVAGMWISWAASRIAWPRGSELRVAAAAVAAALAVALLTRHVEPLPMRAIVFGIPACALVFGAVILERNGWVVRHRLPIALGAASYSIYLVHPFVIGALVHLVTHGKLLPPLLSGVAFVSILAVVCAAGWLSYRLVELPSMEFLKGHLRPQRPQTVSQARILAPPS